MGAEESHLAGDYKEPDLPDGVLEVRVSVYKLELTGVSILDQIGAGLAGAYHSGLVVAREEWAFGGHDMQGKSGVYKTQPELNEDYIFYQRVIMGRIRGTHDEVVQQIRQMARCPQWAGTNYDLIERNCNHFVSELCWMLLKKRPPDWINSTADTIALGRRRKAAEDESAQRALAAYVAEFGGSGAVVLLPGGAVAAAAEAGGSNGQRGEVPGLKAFRGAFEATFDMAWNASTDRRRVAVEACPPGDDPVQLRRSLEDADLRAAALAAGAAALVVATAARTAAQARAAHARGPGVGLGPWDAAWARGSSGLLRRWREQAVAGQLDPNPAGEQGRQRAREVERVLAEAAAAAAAAVEAEIARNARVEARG